MRRHVLLQVICAIALVFLFGPGSAHRAEAQERSCTPEEVDRVTIEARGELMAICCWKNTLLNHSSPRADQLSAEVRRLAEQCYTKQEILDEFVKTHGESILARPQTEGFGLWFYLGPAILLLITGAWLAARVVPRLTYASPAGGGRVEPVVPPNAGADDEALAGRFEAELRQRDA